MFQLYFNFHLLNINKFEEKCTHLILFYSKKTKRVWMKCLELSKIIWYILLFNHLFYQTFWNITILFQNQFVKKSAYDQEISSLKDENSNLQSDVVILYTPITDRTFWMLSTLVFSYILTISYVLFS